DRGPEYPQLHRRPVEPARPDHGQRQQHPGRLQQQLGSVNPQRPRARLATERAGTTVPARFRVEAPRGRPVRVVRTGAAGVDQPGQSRGSFAARLSFPQNSYPPAGLPAPTLPAGARKGTPRAGPGSFGGGAALTNWTGSAGTNVTGGADPVVKSAGP